jgi:hypothetical protein
MSTTSEARSAIRVHVENAVNVMVKGRTILATIAVNISMGGLFLNAAATLPVGSPCEVAIFPPPGSAGGTLWTQGRIVRTGQSGTAIQFEETLGPSDLMALTSQPAPPARTSLLKAYQAYFAVSQSRIEADCQKAFGISKRTFSTITTASFLTSIPVAILPIWMLRAHIPAVPNPAKIALAFTYAAIWLLVLQPILDLGIIRLVRNR